MTSRQLKNGNLTINFRENASFGFNHDIIKTKIKNIKSSHISGTSKGMGIEFDDNEEE